MAHEKILSSDLVDIRDVEINPNDSTEEGERLIDQQKLACYYRLSQEDVDIKSNALKDESNSIHSQRLLCQHFLSESDDLSHLPFEEFIDDGFSCI